MLNTAIIEIVSESTTDHFSIKIEGTYFGLLRGRPLGFPDEIRDSIWMVAFSPDALENYAEMDDRTVLVYVSGDMDDVKQTIIQLYRISQGVEVPF